MSKCSIEKRVFACFVLVLAYFCFTNYARSENPYDSIVKRNAFTLLDDVPAKVDPVKYVEKSSVKLNLTGIMKYRGQTNVYLFSKDIPKRFVTLNTSRRGRSDEGITLIDVSQGMVTVMNNGVKELLSFDTHRLPTIITKAAGPSGPTIVKKDDRRRSDKKEEKKEVKQSTPRPSIIKVPSRAPQVSPKIIEKGLEYLSRMEDGEKKEALLKRMESLQSGQYQIKSDIDRNERRRQYDEWRKKRDK